MKIENIKFNYIQKLINKDSIEMREPETDEIRSKLKEMEHYISLKLSNFTYPKALKDNISAIEENNWEVPLGTAFLEQELYGLQRRYNVSSLVPFAMNSEGREFACFIIDNKNNNRVAIINSFGEPENLFIAEYKNVEEWIAQWF